MLLWCVGEAHAEVLLDRLRARHGVGVTTPEVRVALRETLAKPVTVTGRHVKQSGGHGQYAVAVLEVEPQPAGAGLTYEVKVVGGSVPSQFHGSVEKGVRTQMERGLHPGRPLVDLKVTLVDGKAHSVDSSDAAFQTAGALAVREAASAAGLDVLEPVAEIAVTVPADYVGSVMSDLSGRRARVTGSDPTRCTTTAPSSGPRSRRSSCCATPPTCARCRTAPAPTPAATCGTSRCPRTWCRPPSSPAVRGASCRYAGRRCRWAADR